MKEFKFYGEMTEYVEIPVMVCETQKEMVNEISEVREVSFNDYVYEKVESIEFNRQRAIKERKEHGYSAWFYDEQIRSVIGTSDETSIYIIYKDGSKYFETFGERQGKFKRYGIKAAVIETAYEYTVYGDFAVTDNGDISIEESDIEEYGVYNGQYDVKEEPEATAETVESVEETTVSETETVEETAEQAAEPETFSYEFNEIHKITISKRNNVYVEEFFEKMGGSYVKLGEEAWGCIEDIEEYYGIKINRNVQTDTEESESESEPTAENITVSGTNQDNINVLIVADVINTFEMITHTGYFDTS